MKFDTYAIRLLKTSDVANYFQLVENNRPRLKDSFVGTVSKTNTYEETQNFVEDMVQRAKEKVFFAYVIIDNTNQNIIGFLDLKNIDWNIPKTEIGCYIDENYAGKGITTKAFKIFCEYCFSEHKFKKLFLRTQPNNMAARTVAEKCGFELEGTIRKDYKTTSGELVDLVYYGKLK